MSEARKLFPQDNEAQLGYDASDRSREPIREALRRRSNWSITLGIGLMVLGIFAWGGAAYTTMATVLFIGSVLLVGAAVQLVEAFRWKGWGQFFIHLATGVLYAITGLMMWRAPLIGAASLTLLMASFFIVTGTMRIIGATMLRIGSWGWSVAAGVITLFLGGWMYANLPVASVFLIGTFVGIEMVFSGLAMTMLGVSGRQLTSLTV